MARKIFPTEKKSTGKKYGGKSDVEFVVDTYFPVAGEEQEDTHEKGYPSRGLPRYIPVGLMRLFESIRPAPYLSDSIHSVDDVLVALQNMSPGQEFEMIIPVLPGKVGNNSIREYYARLIETGKERGITIGHDESSTFRVLHNPLDAYKGNRRKLVVVRRKDQEQQEETSN